LINFAFGGKPCEGKSNDVEKCDLAPCPGLKIALYSKEILHKGHKNDIPLGVNISMLF